MIDDSKPQGEDDSYVIEDEGQSVEQIEHEMELAAQEAAADAAAPAENTPTAGAETESSLRDDYKKVNDRYLRTLADFENYRKRTEREKADYFKYALVESIRDLLPVLDNFDRALEHAEEGDDFHKGVLLIYKQLADVLQRHGLKTIEQSNVRFDPNIHEAVVREENAEVPNHTVVAILQKGYFIHDRLLRPALVKVAVGGPEESVAS